MPKYIVIIVLVLVAFGVEGYSTLSARVQSQNEELTPLKSTYFRAARYNRGERTLTLILRDGRVVEYYDLSPKTYFTFLKVRNKVGFFHSHIHKEYRHACVSRYVGRYDY